MHHAGPTVRVGDFADQFDVSWLLDDEASLDEDARAASVPECVCSAVSVMCRRLTPRPRSARELRVPVAVEFVRAAISERCSPRAGSPGPQGAGRRAAALAGVDASSEGGVPSLAEVREARSALFSTYREPRESTSRAVPRRGSAGADTAASQRNVRVDKEPDNAITASMMAPEPAEALSAGTIAANEIIVSLLIYHPKSGRASQGFDVRASDRLTALRDRLYCLSDTPPGADKFAAASFFYFGTTIYDDRRVRDGVETPVLSDSIREWLEAPARRRRRDGGPVARVARKAGGDPSAGATWPPISSGDMHATRFGDLDIQLGATYLWCHQGDCEHIVVFTDVRLVDATTERSAAAYPLHTFQAPVRRARCGVCGVFAARFQTFGDASAADASPMHFCPRCYHPMHYDAQGRLLESAGDFVVLPYVHDDY